MRPIVFTAALGLPGRLYIEIAILYCLYLRAPLYKNNPGKPLAKVLVYPRSMPGVQEVLSSVCGGLVKLARHTGEQQSLRACTSMSTGLWASHGLWVCCLLAPPLRFQPHTLPACPVLQVCSGLLQGLWHLCKGLCKALRVMPAHPLPLLPLGPGCLRFLSTCLTNLVALSHPLCRQGGLDRGHLFPDPGGASDH